MQSQYKVHAQSTLCFGLLFGLLQPLKSNVVVVRASSQAILLSCKPASKGGSV